MLAGIFILSLGACREEIPLKLTSRQAELADTLFVRQATKIRPILDSACDASFDARVQQAVDSMLVIRLQEEAELRARIRQFEEKE